MLSWEKQETINELNQNWVWVENWVDSSSENTAGRLVRFNTVLHLPDKPISATIHLSADTRYKLRVNGVRAAVGPSRGSPHVWFYDTLDISQFLTKGKNDIQIDVIRYFAANRAAMPFERTAFPGLTLSGAVDMPHGRSIQLSTISGAWNAKINECVTFPTGLIDDGFLHIYERGAVTKETDDEAAMAKPYRWRNLNGDLLPHRLQPRSIPMPEETKLRFQTIHALRSSVAKDVWLSWLEGGGKVSLPAFSEHIVDIQASEHATAFLQWRFNAAMDTSLHLTATYSEGFELEPVAYPYFRDKTDRLDSLKGQLLGPFDEVDIAIPASQGMTYEPFWFRTFRLVRLKFIAGPQPVDLISMTGVQTNYPLDVKASWQDGDDEQSEQMWDVSIRTLRNCMFDGYSDCPFYEQLQYSMDSRAVGLFHYLLSGDDRLVRQSLLSFAASTTAEGLTQSRFPSHVNQIIAAFPLYFILQVSDHHLFFGDAAFTRAFVPRIDGILQFFEQHIDHRGLVSNLPSDVWQFVDWVTSWHATDEHPDKGVPSSGRETNLHTYFSLMFSYALQQAADLLHQVGRSGNAAEYQARAKALNEAVRQHCFDGSFFTDSTLDVADESSYSQHCQVFAVLCGAATPAGRASLLRAAFAADSAFSKCSYMMQFYTLRAFALAGDIEYEAYYKRVWDPWRSMLDNNLSTWEEDNVRHRSDCHAWGSVPIYEYATEVAGIQVVQAGCTQILFKPRLKLSREIHAKIALGRTNIAHVDWKWNDEETSVTVRLSLAQPIELRSLLPGQKHSTMHGKVDKLHLIYRGSLSS